MLADDIIAASGAENDRLFSGAFTQLGQRIQTAHRIDLAPEVMRSALTISETAIGPQLRGLALCRLPFRRTWFEWPGTFSGRAPRERELDAPVPKRMGVLVETDASLQRGSMLYAWSHPEADRELGGVNMCPLVCTFDWRAAADPVPDLSRAATWHERATEEDWRYMEKTYPRIGRSARADLIAENQRFGLMVNPLMDAFINMASGSDRFPVLMRAASNDIEGEPPLLRAAVLLLNSKNLTAREPVTVPAKLNAARTKRGRRPLLDHTHVTIKLSRALAARAGGVVDDRQPNRLHLVRGHFKIRSTGVYWWSPHPRGTTTDGIGIREQHRQVVI